MKLIEADKVEQAIKDYWKAQVDRLPIPKSIEEHEAYANRLGTILEYNSDLLKEIEALPSAEQDALEKAVAVEAISDELLSRFNISATYAYDVAESAVNRIEVMAKRFGKEVTE